MTPFTTRKKKILFILPEILGPGGQELENIGFANCLNSDPRLEVQILNFYSFLTMEEFTKLPKAHWDVSSLNQVIFSKQFLKIFIKSGLRLKLSLANCFRNFPHLFDHWLRPTLSKFDLCFTGISPTSLLPHILLLCRKENIAFVYHESSIFNEKNHVFFQQMEKDGYFLISAKEKKVYLLSHYPGSIYKTINQWIYLGQEDFLAIPKKKVKKVKFGSVGRIDLGKNLLVLLKAIKILTEKGCELEFVVYGDGPELTNLNKFTKDSGLDSVVSFEGRFSFDERASCYKEIDVFILTSTFEGGPLVVLEAMAAGKPIISTKVGDVPNRVVQDVNGFLLPVNCSPLELADQMQHYLDHKDMIQNHGSNSREMFLKEFEKTKSENKFKEAILQVLEFHANRLIA